MKLSVLGTSNKGTLDFELESEDEFGFTVKCEGNESLGIFNNVQSFRWISGGKIVYLDPCPLHGDGQFNFSKYKSVKISKAKKKAAETFENHYYRE